MVGMEAQAVLSGESTSRHMERYQKMRAYSAGGVVFRLMPLHSTEENGLGAEQESRDVSSIEVVLVGRSQAGIWTLPKGTPQDGETVERVAIREVQEETGLE